MNETIVVEGQEFKLVKDISFAKAERVQVQPKFEKGDRVVFVCLGNHAAQPGATGTVLGYQKDRSDRPKFVNIAWTKNALSGGQHDGGYYEFMFERLDTELQVISDPSTIEDIII